MRNIYMSIDFNKQVSYSPQTFVKNDYNSIKFNFNTSQNITDKRVFVAFEMSDGTKYLEECTVESSTLATLELPTGVLSVEGEVIAQVALYDGTASRLTAPVQFKYTVSEDLSDEAVTPSDNVPILTQLITDVETLESEIEAAEALRASAENTRESNEDTRIANEAAREEAIDELKTVGDYDSGTTYKINNFVHYNNNLYVAIAETTGNLPTNTTYWRLAVENISSADSIVYDNAISGLTATDVKNAIDEVDSDLDAHKADYVTLKNTVSDHEDRIDTLESITGSYEEVDTSGSPGGTRILQGDEVDGLFGFVSADEFIDGDTLASAIGLTAGVSYKPNSPWAKVLIGGELGFFPILPLRYSIPWDAIYYAGAVHGDGSIGVLPPEGRFGTELEITGANTITTTGHFLGGKSSANAYYDDVGSAGDTIVLAGWDNAGNNGEFTIDTITDSTITIVEGGLTAEVGDRDSKLWPKANEVLQDAEVTIDELTYKVRLFKGFDEDPMNSYADSDRGAVGAGSEWNRIVLPLHERAVAQNWTYPQYAGTTENWKTKLSDEDMILHYSFGSGSYRWCQEVRDDTQTFRRAFRGHAGASYASAYASWFTSSNGGWCPVLILKNS
jgi:hypothetical protein